MLKTLKNYQIFDLMESFTEISKRQIKSNKKFSYAVILNDESLQPKLIALRGIAKPSESYAEYEQKRNEILVEYAEVDSGGNIITNTDGSVVFKDGVDDKVLSLLKELNEEHEDVLVERNKDISDYNEILGQDIEVNIETVDIDDIPEEVGEDIVLMKMLMAMIY